MVFLLEWKRDEHSPRAAQDQPSRKSGSLGLAGARRVKIFLGDFTQFPLQRIICYHGES